MEETPELDIERILDNVEEKISEVQYAGMIHPSRVRSEDVWSTVISQELWRMKMPNKISLPEKPRAYFEGRSIEYRDFMFHLAVNTARLGYSIENFVYENNLSNMKLSKEKTDDGSYKTSLRA